MELAELIGKARAEVILNLDSDLLERKDMILRLQSLIESRMEDVLDIEVR